MEQCEAVKIVDTVIAKNNDNLLHSVNLFRVSLKFVQICGNLVKCYQEWVNILVSQVYFKCHS